jgi:hypothetical protein
MVTSKELYLKALCSAGSSRSYAHEGEVVLALTEIGVEER